jgi:hypothetical protein
VLLIVPGGHEPVVLLQTRMPVVRHGEAKRVLIRRLLILDRNVGHLIRQLVVSDNSIESLDVALGSLAWRRTVRWQPERAFDLVRVQ